MNESKQVTYSYKIKCPKCKTHTLRIDMDVLVMKPDITIIPHVSKDDSDE